MFNLDLPIKTADDDQLHRLEFSKSVAKALIEYESDHSLVFGLYGKWGSGKTSILNMIEEELRMLDQNHLIMRFDPWLNSDLNILVPQFFKQLASLIKAEFPLTTDIIQSINQYATALDLSSIILNPVAGSAVSALKVFLNNVSNQAKKNDSDLYKLKKKIIDKLKKKKIKISVMIDDIDRLSSAEIISIFKLVKNVGDFPNISYILAFDYEVVIRALDEVQNGDGRQYLDKIIQVPFEIPSANASYVSDCLFGKLNKILIDLPEEQFDTDTWVEVYHYGISHYLNSIRDVNRFTNVFSLKYPLLKDETNVVDLLALTCLQVFEPYLYSIIIHHQSFLCDTKYYFSVNEKDTKVKEEFDEFFPPVDNLANEKAAKNILGIIFPVVRSAVGLSNYIGGAYSKQASLINKKASSDACFRRYFMLFLEEDAVPSEQIDLFLYHDDISKIKERLKVIFANQDGDRFIEYIEGFTREKGKKYINEERSNIIIQGILSSWEDLETRRISFFSVHLAWKIWACFCNLLEIIKSKTNFNYISSLFNNKLISVSTQEFLLLNLEKEHGQFTEREAKESGWIVSKEELEKLREIFINNAKRVLNNIDELKQCSNLNFFFLLGEYESEYATQKKIEIGNFNDNKILSLIIANAVTKDTMSTRLTEEVYRIEKNSIEDYMDLKIAYEKAYELTKKKEFLEIPKRLALHMVAFLCTMETDRVDYVLGDRVTGSRVEQTYNKIVSTLQNDINNKFLLPLS